MKNYFICALLFLTSFNVLSAPLEKIKIRIGWQIPWAIQGQVVQILKQKKILSDLGFEVEFIGKTAGPELNELALGGHVDIILTADQPASALFMKSTDWLAISRLMYNRTATYVPLSSTIAKVEDLKNKKIAVPFGTAAQRIISEAVDANKVSGVQFVNLGMLEQVPLINSVKKDVSQWGDFDALSGFDPIPAMLEVNKKVKVIHSGKVCALMVVNKNFLAKNKKAGKNLVIALRKAFEFYVKNKTQANEWFVAESKLTDLTTEAFEIASVYEPNLNEKNKISTSFSDDDFVLIQKAADFVAKNTLKKINIKDFVTNEYQ